MHIPFGSLTTDLELTGRWFTVGSQDGDVDDVARVELKITCRAGVLVVDVDFLDGIEKMAVGRGLVELRNNIIPSLTEDRYIVEADAPVRYFSV